MHNKLLRALMPLLLVLVGVGLVALGLWLGSVLLLGAGLLTALAGVVWAAVVLDLTNPFDWF